MRRGHLDEERMRRPAVNDAPFHVSRAGSFDVSVYGIKAGSSCGTGILRILSEGHCLL